jgi:hypothetical protein
MLDYQHNIVRRRKKHVSDGGEERGMVGGVRAKEGRAKESRAEQREQRGQERAEGRGQRRRGQKKGGWK